MNYHKVVGDMLTQIVRNGGTIESDKDGIKVIGTPKEARDAYEIVYKFEFYAGDNYLLRTRRDEYGIVLSQEYFSGHTHDWHDCV